MSSIDELSKQVSAQQGPVAGPKKRRGCFFYGCLTTILAVLVSLVAVYFVASRAVKQIVETYGTTAPVQLSTAPTTAEQYEAVHSRIEGFRMKLASDQATDPLRLSAEDINSVLQHDARFKGVHAEVSLEADALRVRGSLPLEFLGYKGVFLNGSAKVGISMQAGLPDVRVQELALGNQSIPSQLSDELGAKNLAKGLKDEPEFQQLWSKVDRIEVRDGTLLVTPKTLPATISDAKPNLP